ncbi:MAG: hypothetical protein Q8P41_15310 [Pseudomonadota bacterium]|nr:hypothetical protein [Pseudomonadota bacterium]
MNVDAAVSTLLEDLLDPHGRGLDAAFLAGATQDMKGRVAQMPKHLGAGMAVLTALFVGSGYMLLPKRMRVARLDRWRRSPFAVQRDFVEFWEKMATFTYFSRVEHAMDGEAAS